MCAAKSGTPDCTSAGATMTAAMMYDAVTGTASPRSQTAMRRIHDREKQLPSSQRHDDAGHFQSESGQRHHADDDPGGGRRRRDAEHSDRAGLQRRQQPRRRQAGFPPKVAQTNGEHRCPEDGTERRHARDHEDRNRHQRGEVIAGLLRQRPGRERTALDRLGPEPSRVRLDHAGRSRGSRESSAPSPSPGPGGTRSSGTRR